MTKKKRDPDLPPVSYICNVCRKCWKIADPSSSIYGLCMCGGPFSGYLTDDGRLLTLKDFESK
jgi:hypothetical protein